MLNAALAVQRRQFALAVSVLSAQTFHVYFPTVPVQAVITAICLFKLTVCLAAIDVVHAVAVALAIPVPFLARIHRTVRVLMANKMMGQLRSVEVNIFIYYIRENTKCFVDRIRKFS